VNIQPFSMLLADPSYGLGLAYLKPALEALIAEEIITTGDINYFLERFAYGSKSW
jgi:hypothetical protein